MTEPPPRVGLVSCYFTLFDEQMPAGFRAEREAVVRGYAELLRREFDVVDAGMLTSEAEGEQASALLREAAPDAVVFAPSMAAPPSYAAAALAGLDAPLVDLERADDRPPAGRADAGAGDRQLVAGRRGHARERTRTRSGGRSRP